MILALLVCLAGTATLAAEDAEATPSEAVVEDITDAAIPDEEMPDSDVNAAENEADPEMGDSDTGESDEGSDGEAGESSEEAGESGGEAGESGGDSSGEDTELNDMLEVKEVGGDSVDRFMNYLLILVIVVAVIAAAVIVLFIVRVIRKKSTSTAGKVVRCIIALLLIALIVALNVLATTYASSIDNVFKRGSGKDTSISTNAEQWKQLVFDIADEGFVLLENKNNVLPLESGAKVNLLGYYSYNPFYSGSGSGSVSAADSIGIVTALTDAGFQINPATQALYPEQVTKNSGMGFSSTTLEKNEIAISSYTGENAFDALKAYSDIAIITIGRTGGEGFDLTSYDGDYLELDENENALLQAARDNFSTVIVILNTANALEMEFVDKYDIDAVIWTGEPGPYGFESLGRILAGTVNPSGKLPDTWVYDNDSAPAMENFGLQIAANNSNRNYVDYVEGIYVGYKWYETAYAEKAVITTVKSGKTFDYNLYESIVKYPFGHGLSYTSFKQEITGGSLGATIDPKGEYTVEVKVTNTGTVAGKEAVQLYMTSPYTDYDRSNGVEKAAVQLVAYGKTGILEPNASETVTLTIKAEELAAYDSTHDNGDGTRGTYMLDAGDYVLSIREDAHTEIASVTASVSSQYFYTDANGGRDSDDQTAYNQFEDAARGEYLSRQDAFANYGSAMASVKDTVEDLSYATTDNYGKDAYDALVTQQYVEGVDYAKSGNLKIQDMVGVEFDDPKWDELIKQLTIEELQSLVLNTVYGHPAIESIGLVATSDSDGPLGISSMFNTDVSSIAYPCLPVMAATFNGDLAYSFGSLMADQAHSLGVTGWYAPAMNTHRTPYSGRNFEYYSEDGVLAAGTASQETKGARDKGLIVFMKHFALNDQETKRPYTHTYSNEQAIREIYLKPFEATVKYGGATGVMTSMNYIGDIYAGGHERLLEQVLRNEWGFQGSTLTDMDEGGEIRSVDGCLRAGMDSWLGMGTNKVSAETDADIYYLQRSAHNSLYMEANANMMEVSVENWKKFVTILSIELGIIALVCLAAAFIPWKKKENE